MHKPSLPFSHWAILLLALLCLYACGKNMNKKKKRKSRTGQETEVGPQDDPWQDISPRRNDDTQYYDDGDDDIFSYTYDDIPQTAAAREINDLRKRWNSDYDEDEPGDANKALLPRIDKLLADKDKLSSKERASLASLLRRAGRYCQKISKGSTNPEDSKDALRYLQASLAMQDDIYGDDAPDAAHTLNLIALTYYHQGNNEDALANYEKGLEASDKKQDDRNKAYIKNNIGLIYARQENYDKALRCYEESLSVKEKIYEGQEHATIARTLRNMGDTYVEQKAYEKAFERYNKALTMQKKLYGDQDHTKVAGTLERLGQAYEKKRSYKDAASYYQQAYDMWQALHGEDHAKTKRAHKALEKLQDKLKEQQEEENTES